LTERTLIAPTSRFFGVVYVAFCCWVGSYLLREAVLTYTSFNWLRAGVGDAAVDWSAAQLYWKGVSPYSPEGLAFVRTYAFGHPPTTPFWFLPLSIFPFVQMAMTVGIISVACCVALVAIMVRELEIPYPLATTWLVTGFVVSSTYVYEHVFIVQLSVWIALLCVLAWRCLRRGTVLAEEMARRGPWWPTVTSLLRPRSDLAGGVLLGLACSIKPFPGLIVLYLLVTRRYAAVFGAVTSFFAIACVMAYRWGFGVWGDFFVQQQAIADRWIWSVRNASLHGIVRRALVPMCHASPSLDPKSARITLAAVLAVLVLAFAIAWWGRRKLQSQVAFDRAFWLFAILAAFLNPWVWAHYSVLLVAPALFCVRALCLDYVPALRDWARQRVRAAEIGARTLVAVSGLLVVALVALEHTDTWATNSVLRDSVCMGNPDPGVYAWLVEESRRYEVKHWISWPALAVVLAMLLLVPRHRAAE